MLSLFGIYTLSGVLWSLPYDHPFRTVVLIASGIVLVLLSFGKLKGKLAIRLCVLGLLCQVVAVVFAYPSAIKFDSYGEIYYSTAAIVLFIICIRKLGSAGSTGRS